jgi:DNA modification methylase
MAKENLQRIDSNQDIRESLLPYCRLDYGDVWQDSVRGHKVGCLDGSGEKDTRILMDKSKSVLAVQDPPYNVIVGNSNSQRLGQITLDEYVDWSRRWVSNTRAILTNDSSLYVWLGADQNAGFQPLADFIVMMREFQDFQTRSLITMRNQRGYGTQKNWMAVRQELLYYLKGKPKFNIEAEYTDIPKILRGYYKKVNGKVTENLERSKSNNIRAGNVWVDIQQVFYRMEENVPGCYAQKPLKAIERIVTASSDPGDLIVDFFAHSGTTLMACEKLSRQCFTCDIDPVFAEISIRRLEHYRRTGQTGWQFQTPFPEVEINWQPQDGSDIIITEQERPTEKNLFDFLSMTK